MLEKSICLFMRTLSRSRDDGRGTKTYTEAIDYFSHDY